MKLAIHHRKNSFSEKWIEYCKSNNIDFKLVNVYENDIVEQVKDCDAFMWHHHHGNYKDILFAKQFLFSMEQSGKVVFPSFTTAWHFDDKIGQKYLLESIGVPFVKTNIFYDKAKSLEWIENTLFP
ncbi:MAG: hypothetical protein NXH73_11380, partial [Flavobacteriaceae bacterium]|nr:hypothetical protein [Flavobacteriaceae bacterium]